MRYMVIIALFGILAPCAAAGGQSAGPDELARFCRRADYILHGRVTAQSSIRDRDGLIWTSYTLVVAEPLKAPAPAAVKTFQFRQLGGRVGDLRQVATGSADIRRNDEVILFTRDYGAGFQAVAEGDRGCLRVRTVTDPRRAAASRDRRIVPAACKVAPGRASIDLDRLKEQLREAVKQGAGAGEAGR